MKHSKVLGECFKAQFGEGGGFKALFEKLGNGLNIKLIYLSEVPFNKWYEAIIYYKLTC